MSPLKLLPIITLALTLNAMGTAKAQDIDSALASFSKASPFEKAYVQFDNSKYVAGQTIWYKAYLMSGFEPSLLSKNFYLDWYDDDGKWLSSTVTPVFYSYSAGAFTVPANYAGRYIHAVGYTKWMRNFDSCYFFRQAFQIVSPAKRTGNRKPAADSPTIQFLPESGTLLAGRSNVIAFKAVNKQGLPENIAGIVINDKGDSITSFKSAHDGMGKFEIAPMPDEVYTAEWRDMEGKQHKTVLPPSEESGVNLIIEQGRSSRILHIQRTDVVPDRMYQATLVGQMYGRILFKVKINLADKQSITTSLPVDQLISGLLQVTIFDVNMQPICERVVYVKNDDFILHTAVRIDTLNTMKRGRNTLEIELQDTTYANLSLSVTDALTNEPKGNNILSQLLLAGDLTGYINKPAYYFSSDQDSVNGHLDLVMLTNGWRRYKWDDMLRNPQVSLKYPKDTAYQSISGKIRNYQQTKGNKTESINLIFLAKDSNTSVFTMPVRPNGRFSAGNIIFYDTSKLYYSMNGSARVSRDNISIESDLLKADPGVVEKNLLSDRDTTGFASADYLFQEQRRSDSSNKKGILKEVIVYGKEKTRNRQLDQKYATGIFSSNAIASFDMGTLENTSHTESIFDFLTGKVQGLVVGNTLGGTASVGVVQYRGADVTFYLDERPILFTDLYLIDVHNIAYIKVFSPPFAGGFNSSGTNPGSSVPGGGAIALYSRRTSNAVYREGGLLPGITEFKTITGYTPVKEFYSPEYAEAEQSKANEDLRSTLLWDPWINLDKNHKKVILSFYNNDVTHAFRLVLEGMDGKGKLVYISKLL